MLSKNEILKVRSAIEDQYNGVCTITVKEEYEKDNGATAFQDVEKYVDQPCRLSHSSVYAATNGQTVATVGQSITLFIAPEKDNCQPFQFIIVRTLPNGSALSNTNIKVSLENYTIQESADNAFDVKVAFKLKQYKDFGTKTIVLKTTTTSKKVVAASASRSDETAPSNGLPATYVVKSGDCLWNIAKQYYGNGASYSSIASSNGIANPNLIYPGAVLTIPAT